jgi:hypothetical protein
VNRIQTSYLYLPGDSNDRSHRMAQQGGGR